MGAVLSGPQDVVLYGAVEFGDYSLLRESLRRDKEKGVETVREEEFRT